MNIQPWQLDLLEKMARYKGRGTVQLTGRQMGKSILQAVNGGWVTSLPKEQFVYSGKAEVDGELWYTVKCTEDVGKWIRSLPKKDNWYEHIDNQWYVYKNMFDVHERVYLQLGLKFAE